MKSKFFKIIAGVFILANLGMAEYVKKDNAVYYKYSEEDDSEFKVENVDLGTFKILNDKYAKDRKMFIFQEINRLKMWTVKLLKCCLSIIQEIRIMFTDQLTNGFTK